MSSLNSSPAGRILWIRREASYVDLDSTFRGRYNRAIGIMYGLRLVKENALVLILFYRLESGAVYFIAAISMVVFVSLNDKIFSVGFGIGFGIAQQLLVSSVHYQGYSSVLPVQNIIPTFTLVYIGRKKTRDNTHADSSPEVVPG